MKKTLLYISVISLNWFLIACNSTPTNEVSTDLIDTPASADNPNATESNAIIEFENTDYDFGDIVEGQSVEHTYVFKNASKVDLLINNCEAACGCTVPSWPRQPIKPGEKGEIKVVFDSNGKSGMNNKTVTVYGNIPDGKIVLNFKANVLGTQKTNTNNN